MYCGFETIAHNETFVAGTFSTSTVEEGCEQSIIDCDKWVISKIFTTGAVFCKVINSSMMQQNKNIF